MRIEEARKTLGLKEATITLEDVKRAYRDLSMMFHPDRNKEGAEMMKLINAAKEVMLEQSFPYTFANDEFDEDFIQKYADAFGAIVDLEGINVELAGSWVWVTGNTRPHKDILKEANFRFSPKKKAWYFNTSKKRSFSRGTKSLDDIRNTYGTQQIKSYRSKLAYA